MKKFFRRIGKTGFLILWFIPFAVWGVYLNGRLGLPVAIISYGIGIGIYENWSRIKNFQYKKFFRRNARGIIRIIIMVPVVAGCAYYGGWRGFIASIAGLLVGEFICRKILKIA